MISTPDRCIALIAPPLLRRTPTLSNDVDMSIGTLEPTTLPHVKRIQNLPPLSLGYPKTCLETIVYFMERIPLGSLGPYLTIWLYLYVWICMRTGSHVLRLPFPMSFKGRNQIQIQSIDKM